MSFNLMQVTQLTLGEQIQRIATHFSLDANKAKLVFDAVVPALIGSMLKKADSPEGARDLYASISSSRVDSNIALNLGSVFYSPLAVNNLVRLGSDQVTSLVGEKMQDFTETVASQTKVTHVTVASLLGVASATIFGLMKRYLQSNSGQQHVLLSTLEKQVPHLKDTLHENVWVSLGLGGLAAFFGGIEGKLKSSLTAFNVETPATRTSVTPTKKSSGLGRWFWLWLLLALAVLLFALRSCKTAPVAVAPPVVVETPIAATTPAAPTKEPLLSLTTDKDGKAAISATVGSEAEKNSILENLKKIYGDAFTADIKIDAATKPSDWLNKLGDLLPNFKLPNADLTLKGSDVQLGGAAADAKLGLLEKIKALIGSGFNVSIFSMSEALANAKKMFEESLVTLKPGTCTVADVAKTLNTYSFNFASGSAEIPKEDALLFAKSITAVKACAKDAKLEIGGHTDNVGAADGNMALSQKRAEAVRDFFVSKGIAAASLTTKAYGQTQPVGDNDTASGRFQNRRIEFNEQK